jgi:hypothetical protein
MVLNTIELMVNMQFTFSHQTKKNDEDTGGATDYRSTIAVLKVLLFFSLPQSILMG